DEGLLPPRVAGLVVRRAERRLNLSDDQRQKIKTILRTEKPVIESLAERVHAEREQLEVQPYDEATVRAFAQQHEMTMEDVLVEREKVRSEIQAVLTPEQRKQVAAMRETLYGRFVERLSSLGDEL
ncbi:MAG TPA: Spy/CpxP family protein refolding chaperone, partial [Terracidiphilus sp.]|nr:Spy/CpxP family protein refolding chaperone [Terracidiphilus sp.]